MGTFVQNVHNASINSSTGGLLSEATIRVTQELVSSNGGWGYVWILLNSGEGKSLHRLGNF
jgi:hypothetical protein